MVEKKVKEGVFFEEEEEEEEEEVEEQQNTRSHLAMIIFVKKTAKKNE